MNLLLSPHNDDETPTAIYAVVDDFGIPRYVGQTTKPLATRLAQHRSFASRGGTRPFDVWLRTNPGATIIPLAVSPLDPDEEERRWIRQMRAGGVPLLNVSTGGKRGGSHAQPFEVRRRISEARRGRPLSDSHRSKLSEAHTDVPLSAEHRRAIGDGARGLVRSIESRARLSASKTGDRNPMSRAARARRAANEGGDA